MTNERKMIDGKPLSEIYFENMAERGPTLEDVVLFVGAKRVTTQEDFFLAWIDYHGFITSGSISSIFNAAVKKELIKINEGEKQRAICSGARINTYSPVD